jgi:hypothetical protein
MAPAQVYWAHPSSFELRHQGGFKLRRDSSFANATDSDSHSTGSSYSTSGSAIAAVGGIIIIFVVCCFLWYVCWKTGLHGREPSRAEKLRRAETFNRLANPTPREQWQSAVLKGKDLPLQSFTMNQDSCTICLEVVKDSDNIRPLPCSHMFHQQCFDEWFWTTNQPNKCPLCRTDFIDSSKWPTKPGPPYFVDSMVPGIG